MSCKNFSIQRFRRKYISAQSGMKEGLPYRLLFMESPQILDFLIFPREIVLLQGNGWTAYPPITYYWKAPLFLDHSYHVGEINKFENWWYRSARILEVLKHLFQQFFLICQALNEIWVVQYYETCPIIGDRGVLSVSVYPTFCIRCQLTVQHIPEKFLVVQELETVQEWEARVHVQHEARWFSPKLEASSLRSVDVTLVQLRAIRIGRVVLASGFTHGLVERKLQDVGHEVSDVLDVVDHVVLPSRVEVTFWPRRGRLQALVLLPESRKASPTIIINFSTKKKKERRLWTYFRSIAIHSLNNKRMIKH